MSEGHAFIKTAPSFLQFQCCGGSSFADWELNEYYRCNASQSQYSCGTPMSCCRNPTNLRCGFRSRVDGVSVMIFSSQYAQAVFLIKCPYDVNNCFRIRTLFKNAGQSGTINSRQMPLFRNRTLVTLSTLAAVQIFSWFSSRAVLSEWGLSRSFWVFLR